MDTIKELWSRKRWWIVGGGITFLLLLVIFGIFLFTNFFRQYSYQELEQVMVNAAIQYQKKHPEIKEEDDFVLSSATLVEEGFLNDFTKLRKNDICAGEVEISWNQEYPIYTPFLQCNQYETTTLFDSIMAKEELKDENDNKDGIYLLSSQYGYRGEFVNNYLTFANFLWRIVKFDEEEMMLVLSDTANNKITYVFDDRFNDSTNGYRGRNHYENSRIEASLQEIYQKDLANYHSYLLQMTSCVGPRGELESDKTGSVDCSETVKTPFALLSVYDFMNASLDADCTYTTNRNCSNYNFLSSTSTRYWLLNGTTQNTYEVYYADTNGKIGLDYANAKKDIRPVLSIPSRMIYQSGNGTKENPYQVQIYPN